MKQKFQRNFCWNFCLRWRKLKITEKGLKWAYYPQTPATVQGKVVPPRNRTAHKKFRGAIFHSSFGLFSVIAIYARKSLHRTARLNVFLFLFW